MHQRREREDSQVILGLPPMSEWPEQWTSKGYLNIPEASQGIPRELNLMHRQNIPMAAKSIPPKWEEQLNSSLTKKEKHAAHHFSVDRKEDIHGVVM